MADEGIRIHPFKMEEEATVEYETRPFGLPTPRTDSERSGRAIVESQQEWLQDLISELIKERQLILADTKLSTKEKLQLIESNNRAILLVRGGHYKTFKSEEVVYALLGFSAVVLVVLAALNVSAKLPTEITLAFIGAALGGTIATIAQKLGRI